MAIRDHGRRAAVLCSLLVASACSVANLSYSEVERDLGAVLEVDESVSPPQLHYHSEADQSHWYARWFLLLPFKPLLLALFPDREHVQLENPSGQARQLLTELGPKAGADLDRAIGAVRWFARVLELDPSALNRIVALDGLEELATAHGIDLCAGLELGAQRMHEVAEIQPYLRTFVAQRPGRRGSDGAPFGAGEAAEYRAALAVLSARPLPLWPQRLGLLQDLGEALARETDAALRDDTERAVRNALRHAIQWAVVGALAGQTPGLVDVRLRALELLHRAGGPESVPLLLALLTNSHTAIAAGEPAFDPDVMMQRRLIHLCGQLDRERALRSVHLPGQESWQVVSPAVFLARLVLSNKPSQQLFLLPAREALARCLGRPATGLAEDSDGEDWVAAWLREQEAQ